MKWHIQQWQCPVFCCVLMSQFAFRYSKVSNNYAVNLIRYKQSFIIPLRNVKHKRLQVYNVPYENVKTHNSNTYVYVLNINIFKVVGNPFVCNFLRNWLLQIPNDISGFHEPPILTLPKHILVLHSMCIEVDPNFINMVIFIILSIVTNNLKTTWKQNCITCPWNFCPLAFDYNFM